MQGWKWEGHQTGYKCYEDVYTKKECMDKEVGSYDYHAYVKESCSEYCANKQHCTAY